MVSLELQRRQLPHLQIGTFWYMEDADMGCNYISFNGFRLFTPRYLLDGTPRLVYGSRLRTKKDWIIRKFKNWGWKMLAYPVATRRNEAIAPSVIARHVIYPWQ